MAKMRKALSDWAKNTQSARRQQSAKENFNRQEAIEAKYPGYHGTQRVVDPSGQKTHAKRKK